MRSGAPRALLALTAAIAWAACSSAALESLRRHTYPPNFNYITEDQLKSTMWELASHTRQLDRLVRRSEPAVPPSQAVLRPPPVGAPPSEAGVPPSPVGADPSEAGVPLPPVGAAPSQEGAPLPQPRSETLQQQVILQLTEIDRVAKALGPADWPSNHPQVSRNIEEFRQDIEAARHAAELDPPNYFLAASVTQVCVKCHNAD
jgi:hypothetical protein